MPHPNTRDGALGLCLVLLMVVGGVSAAPYQLRFGYLTNGSFGEAAEKDTAMALSMWGREVATEYATSIVPQAVGFAQPSELAASTLSGKVSMMVMDTYYYITIKSCASLAPSFVQIASGEASVAYVVLVRRKDGMRSLAQLENRVVEVGNRASQILPMVWLDTALAQNKLGMSSTFLRNVKTVKNANKAMLDVFFGSADACVVTAKAFAGANELNPQLGQQLQALSTSGRYVEQVVCISPRAPANVAKIVREGALTLHRKPRGRQILALFGTEKVVACQPAYLKGTRDLVRAYQTAGGKPR